MLCNVHWLYSLKVLFNIPIISKHIFLASAFFKNLVVPCMFDMHLAILLFFIFNHNIIYDKQIFRNAQLKLVIDISEKNYTKLSILGNVIIHNVTVCFILKSQKAVVLQTNTIITLQIMES